MAPAKQPNTLSQRIHVGYIYLHLWLVFMVNVGKYTVPVPLSFLYPSSTAHGEVIMEDFLFWWYFQDEDMV